MPTGYTACVADGSVEDLPTFALQLARGMGALITMRDEPSDAPIPDQFEPSDWSAKRLEEARQERDRLYAMSDQDAQAEADREVAEYHEARVKAEAEHKERRVRYEAMIAKVRAWEGAPEGIKDFALQQLESGMDFDCGRPFRFYRDEPAGDGVAWKAAALVEVARDIEYHAGEDAKERARTERRNAWLAQLRASLAA